jgi:hypothetical protein
MNGYKYLVANPFGTFLARCETMEDVTDFVEWHLNKAKNSYKMITDKKICKEDYQVCDLTKILVYNRECQKDDED